MVTLEASDEPVCESCVWAVDTDQWRTAMLLRGLDSIDAMVVEQGLNRAMVADLVRGAVGRWHRAGRGPLTSRDVT